MFRIQYSDILKSYLNVRYKSNSFPIEITFKDNTVILDLSGDELILNAESEDFYKKLQKIEGYENVAEMLVNEFKNLDTEDFFIAFPDSVTLDKIIEYINELENQGLIFDLNNVSDENLDNWICEDAESKIVLINLRKKQLEISVAHEIDNLILEKPEAVEWANTILYAHILKSKLKQEYYDMNIVGHIVDYLNSEECLNNQIGRTSFEEMEKKSQNWIDDFNKKIVAKRGIEGIDFKTCGSYEDYVVVHLLTAEAKKTEGKEMDNCIGRIHLNNPNIFSIRKGHEIVASADIRDNIIREIKGYDNKEVLREHWTACRKLLENVFQIDFAKSSDISNIGLIKSNFLGISILLPVETVGHVKTNYSSPYLLTKKEIEGIIEKASIDEKVKTKIFTDIDKKYKECPFTKRLVSKHEYIYLNSLPENLDKEKMNEIYNKVSIWSDEHKPNRLADSVSSVLELKKIKLPLPSSCFLFTTEEEFVKFNELNIKSFYGYHKTLEENNDLKSKLFEIFIDPKKQGLIEEYFDSFYKQAVYNPKVCPYYLTIVDKDLVKMCERSLTSHDKKYIDMFFQKITYKTFDDFFSERMPEQALQQDYVYRTNSDYNFDFKKKFSFYLNKTTDWTSFESSLAQEDRIPMRTLFHDFASMYQFSTDFLLTDKKCSTIYEKLLPWTYESWIYIDLGPNTNVEQEDCSVEYVYHDSSVEECEDCSNAKLNAENLSALDNIKSDVEEVNNTYAELRQLSIEIADILTKMQESIDVARKEMVTYAKNSVNIIDMKFNNYYSSCEDLKELMKTFKNFQEDFQKSEWLEEDEIEELVKLLRKYDTTLQDYERTRRSVEREIDRWSPSSERCSSCHGMEANDSLVGELYGGFPNPDDISHIVEETMNSYGELQKFMKEDVANKLREMADYLKGFKGIK